MTVGAAGAAGAAGAVRDAVPDAGPEVAGLRITWLGHATVVLDIAGVRILTDPLLRAHAGLLRRRGAAPATAAWAGADAVLISHLHHDHAELGSLRLLGDTPVVSGRANARWLHSHGVARAQGLSPDEWWRVPGGLAAGGSAPGGPVRVRLARAEHGHRPMPHRPNAAHGFLLAAPGLTVWFAGDTGPFPEMADLAELAGAPVDLAVVPVGGWGPRLSGGHLDPVQAAHACTVVGARYAVPVHWGTLHAPVSRRLPPGWMDRAGPAFAAALARTGGGTRAIVLEPGQGADVPGRGPAGT